MFVFLLHFSNAYYNNHHHYDTTYGELTERGLKALLDDDRIQKEDAIFLDLGMGKGRVVRNVAQDYPNMKQVRGIELLASRFESAKQKIAALPYETRRKVDIQNDDFFKFDWSEADIIYTSNLCFGPQVMTKNYSFVDLAEVSNAIGKKIEKECKKGTWVFASSDLGFKNPEIIEFVVVKQTWDEAGVLYKWKL